jgi:hypothetical protein
MAFIATSDRTPGGVTRTRSLLQKLGRRRHGRGNSPRLRAADPQEREARGSSAAVPRYCVSRQHRPRVRV